MSNTLSEPKQPFLPEMYMYLLYKVKVAFSKAIHLARLVHGGGGGANHMWSFLQPRFLTEATLVHVHVCGRGSHVDTACSYMYMYVAEAHMWTLLVATCTCMW